MSAFDPLPTCAIENCCDAKWPRRPISPVVFPCSNPLRRGHEPGAANEAAQTPDACRRRGGVSAFGADAARIDSGDGFPQSIVDLGMTVLISSTTGRRFSSN